MTDTRAAKRYARALFQASLKESEVAQVDQDLSALAQAIHQSDGLRAFLLDPTIHFTEKNEYLDRALGARFSPLSLGLVKLAVSKGREHELVAIQLEFAELRRRHEQMVLAVVESAQELDKDQKDMICAKIASVTGRRVEAEYRVEPSLIGGVRVLYDDMILDGSARGHLTRMKEALMRDALKQA